MNKQDKRSIMKALGNLDLSEEQALSFIKNLVDYQMFKSPRAYEMFCVDCGIFYTSDMGVLVRKMKVMSDDEVHKWSEDFIDKCSYSKMTDT